MRRRVLWSPGRRDRRERRGGAAVEFVLTLPIYVLLLLGTVEYGNFLTELAMVYQATGDACRYASQSDSVPTAIADAENAQSQLLVDLGYPCAVGDSSCTLIASVVSTGSQEFLTCTSIVDYDQLTNVVPLGDSGLALALPGALKAEVSYPMTGL